MIPGQLVEIYEQGELLSAIVLQIEKNNALTLQAEDGRKIIGYTDRVIDYPDSVILPQGSDWKETLRQYNAQVKQARETIDLGALWEILVETEKSYTLCSLASLVFSKVTPPRRGALLRVLTDDSVYFQQKREHFVACSRKKVINALKGKERSQQALQSKTDFIQWMKQAKYQTQAPPLPPNTLPWIQLFVEYAVFPEKLESVQDVRELLIEGGYTEEQATPGTAFHLLVQAKHFRKDENLWLHRYAWPSQVSPCAKVCAEEIVHNWNIENERSECAEEFLYAIDTPETREIDDAISLIRCFANGGWRVGVHIADPDHFVSPGDLLDQEAQKRATTLYLADSRITLFPPLLADGPMSLLPGENRPGLSFFFTIGADGEMSEFDVSLRQIRVHQRLSYEEADEAIYTGGPDGDRLAILLEAAEALRQKRLDEGALIFSKQEVYPFVDKDNQVSLKRSDTESPSRELVAELMIAANVCTAKYFSQNKIPAIYRGQSWHRSPPSLLGFPQEQDPANLFQLTHKLHKSEIFTQATQHVGLGLCAYVQMTSPIRRYTDLLLHRQLKAHLNNLPLPYDTNTLWNLAQAVEKRLNQAKEIEAWSREYWMLCYFQQHPDLETTAVVLQELEEGKYQIELVEYSFRTVYRSRQLWVGDKIPVKIRGAHPRAGIVWLSSV